ncbi:toprim domain-containing protein, partial [Skermanella aerolata]
MTGARYVRTDPIKEAVAGHELDVLSAIGIDWRGGRGHINCPYPDHGGKDDWRWDDSKACAFCTCIGKRPDEGGSHSIFDVVSAREGIDFEKAKVRVAEIIGCTDLIEEGGGGPRGQKQDAASLLSAPAENRDDALPRKYLAFRLGIEPAAMLMPTTKTVGIKALGYFDLPDAAGAKPKLVGMFPCAVFETIDAMGRRHAFRIYVAPDGQGKADLDGRDPKKSVRASDGVSTAGRSVLWGDPATAPHIIVCEGIETGAAVAVAMRTEIEAGKVVVAAAISASGIEAFQPWPATKHITVAADRDEKRTLSKPASRRGEKAARNFGAKLHDRVSVAIAMPGAAGEKADWLDIFLRDGLDAVRAGMQAAEPFEPSEDEAAAADADKEHAAELDDIVTAYPLPALGGTRLCYRHMPGGDIWVHKVTRISSGEETMVPVFSPLGVIAMLRHADQDDAYGLRVAVQDMSGQPRLVDFDRADLGRMNGVEIKAALFEAGLRVEADGEAIVVAILKAAKPTREMVVVSRPGWHRLTADVPVFVDPSGEVSGLPDGQNLELSAGARLPVPSAAGTFDDWRAAIETV